MNDNVTQLYPRKQRAQGDGLYILSNDASTAAEILMMEGRVEEAHKIRVCLAQQTEWPWFTMPFDLAELVSSTMADQEKHKALLVRCMKEVRENS